MRVTRQGLFIAKPFGLTIVVARFVNLNLFRRARQETNPREKTWPREILSRVFLSNLARRTKANEGLLVV